MVEGWFGRRENTDCPALFLNASTWSRNVVQLSIWKSSASGVTLMMQTMSSILWMTLCVASVILSKKWCVKELQSIHKVQVQIWCLIPLHGSERHRPWRFLHIWWSSIGQCTQFAYFPHATQYSYSPSGDVVGGVTGGCVTTFNQFLRNCACSSNAVSSLPENTILCK